MNEIIEFIIIYYHLQIHIEQALAALEAKLEIDVLDAYMKYLNPKINEPDQKYR